MIEKHKVWAIIPAGGVGARMSANIPKQYLRLRGRPILHHTLSRICANSLIYGVVLGISAEDRWWNQNPFSHPKFLGTFESGKERASTVLSGLKYLSSLETTALADWALVHDAVRPCITQKDIENVISHAIKNQFGALLGRKLVDTLKITDENGVVQSTVDRNKIWRALTPQVFRLGELSTGLERSFANGVLVTDESMAMEYMEICPTMVEGHSSNIKITLDSDLDLVDTFLAEYP